MMNTADARGAGTTNGLHLTEQTRAYGCPELVHLAGKPTSAHVDYLDLLRDRLSAPLLPEAVAEFQGRPVMYLVDGEVAREASNRDADAVQKLQLLLANRSEQACLGIVRPGSLDVYPINLDRKQLAKATPLFVQQSASDAPTFFQSLAAGAVPLQGQPKEADSVFHEIHHLLSKASATLVGRMRPLDVLSVTGRALFFRFLLDRHIILDSERGEICPDATDLKDSFSNAEKAAATSCWLDETFNGDLLPLTLDIPPDADADDRRKAYVKLYRKLGIDTQKEVFRHLQAILRGWKSYGQSFQLRIDWDDFNFAHIPIGVLSQVYETFSRQWDGEHAKKASVYYTPKNIARCLVEEAFGGLEKPADAHVLDGACGAGIFLVLAFRKLVRARWEKDGRRPDTRDIQSILYDQIRGFDVSESALRLAALALYITAIELNGSPRPPKSLRFPRSLQGQVLFNFGQQGTKHQNGFVLGSLGPDVPDRFNGVFDVVMGNPPWTRLRAEEKEKDEDKKTERKRLKELNDEFTKITRRVLTARKLEDIAKSYTNPDNDPDLAFVWRAAEWAKKPGGLIAMALPGRILLKQSDQGKAARTALMRGLRITGIINGSNLSDTDVWPKMNQPFMLFFARNAVPPSEHRFYFATPVFESPLNNRGLFRLDNQAAEPVEANAVVEKPWLLKTLAVGTLLDADVMDSVTSLKWKTVGDFWVPPTLHAGKGYSLKPLKVGATPKFLAKLPDFVEPGRGFRVKASKLETFQKNHGNIVPYRSCEEALYQAPLLIVPKSPGEGRLQPKSYRSARHAICFSQSYYGFSAAGHPDAEVLVSLLYLITHSLLFQYYCLMVSSSIGAERRMFVKLDLESFPFPEPESLTSVQKRRILDLADKLETQATKPWEQVDNFIFKLYGLDEDDATVVRDTLAVGAPYKPVRGPAERPANPREAEIFRSYLEEMLQPSFAVVGQQVHVRLIPADKGEWESSWRFLSIAINNDELPVTDSLICRLMEEANKAAASRVVMRVPEGGLLLGVLNQLRFWTRSRARLCGVYLLRHHLDAFPFESRK